MNYAMRPLVYLALFLLAFAAHGQNIMQSRGADPRIEYRALTRYGPWDDRNYAVTLDDLKLLAPNEEELTAGIPAFYRVELRKRFPHWPRVGPAQYPRAASQLFEIEYGGLLYDGVLHSRRMRWARTSVPVSGEVSLNDVLGANEITIEINPSNHDLVIAGANNIGGQEMYYSSDGGQTWQISGLLPETCCDPTVGWSSDGTLAYAASLSNRLGVNFYRSTNHGQTWDDPIKLTTSGSDKEFLHVDLSPASPYRDNIYLTWHDGNTMQFARSRDRGVSFDPIQAFEGTPLGIGSDITTDAAGNVYYFYAAFLPARAIMLLKSTDGGDTWEEPKIVAPTIGSFTFPIPAMPRRLAWIYAACDADTSDGPFGGSVYVSWTDVTAPESLLPQDNHTAVRVAYSRDGGNTWTVTTPHSTEDTNQVDRFNQWHAVDESGVVHVVYYDTRNSTDRTGVDLYYTFSLDGAATWTPPARISAETSPSLSDGMEWGDYNGLAVLGDKVLPAWTDNRGGPPDRKEVVVADVENVTSSPTFLLVEPSAPAAVCQPGALEVTVDVLSLFDFDGAVGLAITEAAPGLHATLEPVVLTPPGQAVLRVADTGGVSPGLYSFTVTGTATGVPPRSVQVRGRLEGALPAAPVPVFPANGSAYGGFPTATLTWSGDMAVPLYHVQLSSQSSFATLLADVEVDTNAFETATLVQGATYYWRVAAINVCGRGGFSAPYSFVAEQPETQGTDLCEDAPDAVEGIPLTGTTVGATGTDITSCASGDSLDVWFRYVPGEDGVATFDLCASRYDTTLAIFQGCGGPELACNDDACGGGVQSEITMPVVAGTEYRVRISGWNASTGTYTLLVTLNTGGEGEGEGEAGPVDCAGAQIRDNLSGATGTQVSLAYQDEAAGGAGGELTLVMPHPERVDRVRVQGSDGFSRTIPATGTLTQLAINTRDDGSPSAMFDLNSYTVRYEIESPPGSGVYEAGAPCTLTATWQPVSCTVLLVPPRPDPGGPVEVRVLMRNARLDTALQRFALLSSDAPAWSFNIPLGPAHPAFSLDGRTIVFSPAASIASWGAPNAGLYTATATGPGSANICEAGASVPDDDPALHSADTDADGRVSLTELLRVIQFFNTGGFQCADGGESTEDGFLAGAGPNHLCQPHDADYTAPGPDWRIQLTELLRVVQFFNAGGYHYCPGTGTEDGFCAGAAG